MLISCGNHTECSIDCIARGSCEDSIVDCSSSTNCNIRCSSSLSCHDTTVRCPPHGTCTVNCTSSTESDRIICDSMVIQSNLNTTLNMLCRGSESCTAAQIDCDQSRECNLDCHGESACGQSLAIHGENAGLINITDCDGDSQVCDGLNVYCPPSIEEQKRCFLPGKC